MSEPLSWTGCARMRRLRAQRTGAMLSSKQLIPNVAIRSLVNEWKEKTGSA